MLSNCSNQMQIIPGGRELSTLTPEDKAVSPEMAASMTPTPPGPGLSQKQRRACLKRDRRKRKRQALAKLRDAVVDGDAKEDNDEEDEESRKAEEERERLHQEWLERERVAQEEFRLKKEKEEALQKRKEEEERRIREEWEEQQRKEKEEREQKQQEKKEREEAVQKMLDQAESQLENDGPWKNPDATEDYGTEKDRANCPFFLKTGACRFGERCSRKHAHPAVSTTLMVRGMFVTFEMEQSRRDDYDTDASLEYSEDEVYQQFLDFYDDVLPEFKSAGKVVQFKVSCNYEPHLRGNVYVQYNTEDQCREAFMMFNGRWYAGKQLQCEFSPVTRWKTAICGLFDRRRCPKGKHCNFLHVFRNPSGEFWEADRDLHMSPDRGGDFSIRNSERRERMRSQHSYSPERSQHRRPERRDRSRERRSHSRERRGGNRERRSRSREKKDYGREGRDRSRERPSGGRSRESRRSWRQRSDTHSDRSRRSRSRERRRSRSRSRDREWRDGGGNSPENSRRTTIRRSKSTSPKDERVSKCESTKKRRRSESSSPKNSNAAGTLDGDPSPRHHKHSKKSKKKKGKKKKRKRKRSRSGSVSSSLDSGKESGDEKVASPKCEVNAETSRENITASEYDTQQTAEAPAEGGEKPCSSS